MICLKSSGFICLVMIFSFLCLPGYAFAGEDAADRLVALSERLENPADGILNVAFENSVYFRYGPSRNDIMDIFSIKPVLPVPAGAGLNVIIRPEIPLAYVPWPEEQAGLGDILIKAYLAEASQSGWSWGIGPVMGIPTATSTLLGRGQWTAGPAVAAVYTEEAWVAGITGDGLFSIAGTDSRGYVDEIRIRPFVYLNYPDGWYLFADPELTCNFNLPDSQQWTVPLGGGIGKTFTAGKQALSAYVSGYAKFKHPADASDLYLKAGLSLLYPK
jgi:hypothetical protein